MQHPETDARPSSLHWGENEQTMSVPIPLMTGIGLSHNSVIPASMDNPVSYAQADGNSSMSSASSG